MPARPRPTRSKGKKPANHMTEEGRAKLSALAKERHAKGEFGGSKFGKLGGRGNTRAKREAQRAVAAAAGEDKEAIIQVFRDAIDPDRPMGQRLKGAELYLNVEREDAKMNMAEERQDSQQLDRAQLISLLAAKLTDGPASELVKAQLDDPAIVDAEVVDEEAAA